VDWTRSHARGLARDNCFKCNGSGLVSGPELNTPRGCGCVHQAIFWICFDRFKQLVEQDRYLGSLPQQQHAGASARGRKDDEFIADFVLVGQRSLSPFHNRIFSVRVLLRADSKFCCDRLGINLSTLRHGIYTISERLGRVYAELGPLPLFPLDEYFNGPPLDAASIAAAAIALATEQRWAPRVYRDRVPERPVKNAASCADP
jgi:hypothetical protein